MSREDWTDTPTEPIEVPDLDKDPAEFDRLWYDPVDPADVAPERRSRRLAAQPPAPSPIRALDLRQRGPVIPRHGALGRFMTRQEEHYARMHPEEKTS